MASTDRFGVRTGGPLLESPVSRNASLYLGWVSRTHTHGRLPETGGILEEVCVGVALSTGPPLQGEPGIQGFDGRGDDPIVVDLDDDGEVFGGSRVGSVNFEETNPASSPGFDVVPPAIAGPSVRA